MRCELRCTSEQVQEMPALPRAAEQPRSRNGFVELFKEEDVHLGWVTVRKTVLTHSLQLSRSSSPPSVASLINTELLLPSFAQNRLFLLVP